MCSHGGCVAIFICAVESVGRRVTCVEISFGDESYYVEWEFPLSFPFFR